MRKVFLALTAVLVVLVTASAVMANIPGVLWLQDDFAYNDNTTLKNATPNWTGDPGSTRTWTLSITPRRVLPNG